MSGFIPKEKLTAYQRWELAAFDEAEREAELPAPPPPSPPPPGYASGYEEGSAQAQTEVAQIHTLLSNIDHSLQDTDQRIADQLLTLAIEIAAQVLRQSLRLKPELLLPAVREAVATLAAHHGQPALFVNPNDAALI
ncbi:MAG: hypothetical protein JZU63_02630, partial [Rhodoferax sp.]|nr:hypothetical protein [Rhodoferax sp.]